MSWFEKVIANDYEFKLNNIGRVANLLIILNFSVFIASGLVQDFKYYFPIIALVFSGIILFFMIFPFCDLLSSKKLCFFLFLCLILSSYFTLASVIYLVQHGDYSELISCR